jgi:hypothetical protein
MKKIVLGLMIACFAFNANAGQEKKNERTGYQLIKKELNSSVLDYNGNKNLDYTTAVGFRFGIEGGITLKHFISADRAVEGILSTGWPGRGIRLTALYEIHAGAFEVERLSWFYGIGGHIGHGRYGRGKYDIYKYYGPVIGIDGIIGIEYQIKEIPFSASLDLKPAIDILGWGSGHYGDIALSIRYVIR